MKSRRSPRGAALQAEFAVCLLIFLLVTAFPMLDLLGLAAGFATAAFAAIQSAHKASLATTYPEAVAEALDAAYGIAGGCFGTFAALVPNGGLSNSGVDLYVYVTDINSGTVKVFGPNSAVTDKIDPAANIYEYCARVNYHCGPMINMSSVPFVKDVPGLGKPFELTYSAFRATEYSDGLSGTGNAAPLLGSQRTFYYQLHTADSHCHYRCRQRPAPAHIGSSHQKAVRVVIRTAAVGARLPQNHPNQVTGGMVADHGNFKNDNTASSALDIFIATSGQTDFNQSSLA
jgi:hypothetical protein